MTGTDATISFIKGQRGALKLIYQDHTYICVKQQKGSKYWTCSKQRSKKCLARLITDLDVQKICAPRRQRGNKKHDQTKWLKIDLSPILQKPSEPVVLVPCRLGGMKVFYQGYYFEYHTSKSGIKHYRCVHHAQHDCKARIIVKASRVYEFVPMHNHPHDDDA
uniref:FLYWCH-type domain-containing protein n=1 Tax=Anopheles quadriannulatus TaxID=34691 RepID=A0A182XK50_ANOQN